MKQGPLILSLTLMVLFLWSCKKSSPDNAGESGAQATKVAVPDWSRNASLYEVNIRQFTPEGTFEAIRPHLPRLQQMGVDILWFMPIHPISEVKRKGPLGSYYACSDYRAVNPEYGNKEDFAALVRDIHERGMRVIIDWVPHHTGWDHPWVKEHPEYFNKDSLGNITDPVNEETGEKWGWTDVAELNFNNAEMRREIIGDMRYWIDSFDIDGFRVDHAHGLPAEYWHEVSDSLANIGKPLFMLAEGEHDYLRNDSDFVATYAWKFHHAMNHVAQGKAKLIALDTILRNERREFTFGYPIYFTSNHDENSWAGTVFERLGDGHLTFAALAATIDGMPLIYSGQESGLDKRLEFFEKDTIDWGDYKYADFYATLLTVKKRNQALWNGEDGGLSERINKSDSIYAFSRSRNGDSFVGILNLTPEEASTELDTAIDPMQDIFTGEERSYSKGESITLGPWEYILLSNK